MNEITRTLLDAVDDLTLARIVPVWQKVDPRGAGHEHTWEPCRGKHAQEPCREVNCDVMVCKWCDADSTAALPGSDAIVVLDKPQRPLIEQLEEAVASNIAATGGLGRSPSERVPLDPTAFDLLSEIKKDLQKWVADLGGKAGGGIEPTRLVRSWYALWQAQPYRELLDRDYMRAVDGWSVRIRNIVDPPTPAEITSPCPACGEMWAIVGEGESRASTRAIWAYWREDAEESWAECKACERRWEGVYAMRTLRIWIDDRKRALVTVEQVRIDAGSEP